MIAKHCFILIIPFLVSCSHVPYSASHSLEVNGQELLGRPISDSSKSACLITRFDEIEKLGKKQKRFINEYRSRLDQLPLSEVYKMTGCEWDYSEAISQLEEPLQEAMQKDRKLKPILLAHHEGHHLLGTFGDIIAALKSEKDGNLILKSLLENGYRYYTGEALNPYSKIPYFPDTPKSNSLCRDFQNLSVFHWAKTYFCKETNDNNFYVLLDEWNAYLQDVPLHTKLGFVYDWAPASTVEFQLYTIRYLENLQISDPSLFKKLTGNNQIKRFLNYLYISTREKAKLTCPENDWRCSALKKELKKPSQILKNIWIVK
jgi:hypothetical protein